MHGAHEFLEAVAIVLCVAAVTTVLFQRLHQPVVLGYIIAGLIVGPYVPIPLVADAGVVQALSELGVILLMFSLGLEFSLQKLARVGPTAGVTALVQCSLMLWLGFVTGRLLGWTTLESLFTGALIAISSTTIIAKVFDEQGVRGRLREVVVGILVVEDLIAILLMAALTAIATGAGLSPSALASTVGRLAAFLVGLVAVGLLVVPRAVRAIQRFGRPETTLVATVGFCFAVALLAQAFGYSVALGAFIAGSLVAESGEGEAIEHLIHPVRDIFAAIFFVSVGMMIDPALVAEHWAAVLILTAVVVVGKLVGVTTGAFLTGAGTRLAIQSGMSLAQIGEFSFIIAGLGLSLGATGKFLYPVAISVSAITTLITPWLIRWSSPVANWVDRKLPPAIQTYAALYGSWLEQLRSAPREKSVKAAIKRLAWLLVLDTALLAAIVAGASHEHRWIVARVEETIGIRSEVARPLVVAAVGVLALPFCVGIVRVARKLGVMLAELALPKSRNGRTDLAAAPRRALVVSLQLACVLMVGAPLLAVTQPFLGAQAAVVFGLVVVALSIAFWRSAADLQGHVRAGAQTIAEVLRKAAGAGAEKSMAEARRLLPGLGEPEPFQLETSHHAVGKTLAQLNVRGLTGATVLAITRGDDGVLVPTGREVLRAGDVLALAGAQASVAAARALLASGG